MKRQDIRNIAIIAHIDHGKTTLVDGMLRQAGVFRVGQEVAERVMDSNDLERERGITIFSKNAAIEYKGVKLNIVDTPGHVDFSGEVERILGMVDGCLLLVDAFEGPMAQTRFVLKKALEFKLTPILVVNKIDRPDARLAAVVDEVLELFIDLDASEDQLNFPIVYASARQQIAGLEPNGKMDSLEPLFETILHHVPAPECDAEGTLQMVVSRLDYDDYIGRLALGRIVSGTLTTGGTVGYGSMGETVRQGKIQQVFTFAGLGRKAVQNATAGDLCAVAGLSDVALGATITDFQNPRLLPGLSVEEPTLAMTFLVSDSPLAGSEGKYVTSRHLGDRLRKEGERDAALRVSNTDSPDAFEVCGRGELHLGILLETMRREGYELSVSSPRVLTREIDGQIHEPLELLTLDIPEDSLGAVMEMLGERRGEMRNMSGSGTGRLRLEFVIPMRGLLGFRSDFLTLTRGYGVMNHLPHGFGVWRGEIAGRSRGSLIASEPGTSTAYALTNLQDRGVFFIDPQERIYSGMVVGEHCRPNDLEVNVCKKKHVTNMRSSTSEETVRLEVPRKMTLEQALEFIAEDELVEVTPKSIRVRKALLDPAMRNRVRKGKEKARLEAVG